MNKPHRRYYDAAAMMITSGAWGIDADAGILISRRWGKRMGSALPRGHIQVVVRVDGRQRHVLAHRVIWEYVHGPIADPNLVINHINNDPADNRIANLELVTQRRNIEHATELGCMSRGETRPLAKLTEDAVREIRRAREAGATTVELGKRYGVNSATISRVARGERWAHVAA